MSQSQYFLHNLLDMGSLLETILGTMLNYKRGPMSTVKGPFIGLILTVAHMINPDIASASPRTFTCDPKSLQLYRFYLGFRGLGFRGLGFRIEGLGIRVSLELNTKLEVVGMPNSCTIKSKR